MMLVGKDHHLMTKIVIPAFFWGVFFLVSSWSSVRLISPDKQIELQLESILLI